MRIHALFSTMALALSITTANASSSSGCGTKLGKGVSAGGDSQTVNIKSSGISRSYNIYIPETYNISSAAPLIFSYHGGSQTAEEQEELSQLSDPEFNSEGIAVYPQGIDNCWQGVPGCQGTDDIEFTQNIVDDVSSSYCVDSTRIWATGMSDGGGFLGLLACNETLSSTFAAFAPVSGAFYNQNATFSNCTPSRTPIPILEFHGSDDTTIPYEGGPRKGTELPSIPAWLSSWADKNGDNAANTTSQKFKDEVQVSQWKDFTIGYLIDGLGHDWPSTEPNDENTTPTVLNATTVIMEFFSNNTLSSTSASSGSPTATGSSSTASSTGSSTGSGTGAASSTAKSAAVATSGLGWEYALYSLAFSIFVSSEVASVGAIWWSKCAI